MGAPEGPPVHQAEDFIPLPKAPPTVGHTPEIVPDIEPDPVPVYTPPDDLVLLSISPDHGDVIGEDQVEIQGIGFVDEMVVMLDQTVVQDLFILTENMAVFRTPAHPMGVVDLRAYIPDPLLGEPYVWMEDMIESAYVYESDLVVSEITPDEGHVLGGQEVTVVGEGFGPDARFFVDGHAGIDQEWVDHNTLVGLAPPGAHGPADVQVTSNGLSAVATHAYSYRDAPQISSLAPSAGPSHGGTAVRIYGAGLTEDADVFFGDHAALVADGGIDGSWLDVVAPAGPPGPAVSVTVTSAWGSAEQPAGWAWVDPAKDPYVLACTHGLPSQGPEDGGTEVIIACQGLQYGVDVRFGQEDAIVDVVDSPGGQVHVTTPPSSAGVVDVTIESPFASVTLEDAFSYEAPAGLVLDAVEPSVGTVDGGTALDLHGAGFDSDAVVFVGAMAASDVTFLEDGLLSAVTPSGPPGTWDVRVVSGGDETVLEDAFTYTTGILGLDLISPASAAQCGGTYLQVMGDGFTEETEVWIGGEVCEHITFVSPAEIHVRSPKLPTGLYDALVVDAGLEAGLEGALSIYDPRSGYSGTWGPPIDGALNVTVRGKFKWGPVAGAFVMATDMEGQSLTGYTDKAGQVTLSEPWLTGPVYVTVSGEEFTTYSVLHFDATNLTVYVKHLGPPGKPIQYQYPPDAILKGQVVGLGKYTVPVPGPCSVSIPAGAEDCKVCNPEEGCGTEGYACVDLLEQGHRCLAPCEMDEDCPEDYVCAGVDNTIRCIPHPGELIAQCGVSNKSVFYSSLSVPETGWVPIGGFFELPSTRLSEIAIICLGGYRNKLDEFTPTVLGVRRNIVALSGIEMTGLDVTLDHPLKRSFHLKIMDPPTWPDGTMKPTFIVSLDLGPDGAIPFTRTPIPSGENRWSMPRQLADLKGNLSDGKYTFYTVIRANTKDAIPSSYNLVQQVRSVVEERLPIHDGTSWALETSQVKADLFGIWASASDAFFAVGAEGRIIRYNGLGWTAQSSGTKATLRGIDGRSETDVIVVGDDATVLHWNGLAWLGLDGPEDHYRAVTMTESGDLYVAGSVRLRRRDADGNWFIEGPPWLQAVRSLDSTPAGQIIAVGDDGLMAMRTAGGAWTPLDSPTTVTLRDVYAVAAAAELVAVGDDGTIVQGAPGALEVVTVAVTDHLTAVTGTTDGTIHVLGDNGRALTRDAGAWQIVPVPDYRSMANDVFAPSDGGPTRAVGGVDFILGPYLHYTIPSGPYDLIDPPASVIQWDWEGGEGNDYTKLVIWDETGLDLWTLIVDGDEKEAILPDIGTLASLPGLGSGTRRLDIWRVLNENFDIDNYTSREFTIWKRSSWTLNRSTFVLP